jgi:TonB family protein
MRALLVLLVLAATAAADPAPDHSAEVASAIAGAIKAHDAKALAAELAVPLQLVGGPGFGADCKKTFGNGREVKDAAELPIVAKCVLAIDGIADYTVVPHTDVADAPKDDHAIHIFVPRGAKTASILMVFPKRDPNAPAPVAPSVLNAYRISGQTQIVPDAKTQDAMQKARKKKVIGAVKMCLDATGKITDVVTVKETGFPDYDKQIVDTVRTWKYKPYMVNGVATAACTAIMFIYSQS